MTDAPTGEENHNCCIHLADPSDIDCHCCVLFSSNMIENKDDYTRDARTYLYISIIFGLVTTISVAVVARKLAYEILANGNRCNSSCGYMAIPIFFLILTFLFCFLHVPKKSNFLMEGEAY